MVFLIFLPVFPLRGVLWIGKKLKIIEAYICSFSDLCFSLRADFLGLECDFTWVKYISSDFRIFAYSEDTPEGRGVRAKIWKKKQFS